MCGRTLRGRGPLRTLRGLLWLRSRRLPSLQSLRRLFRLQLRLLRFLGRLPLHLLEALFRLRSWTKVSLPAQRANCCVACGGFTGQRGSRLKS